MRLNVSVGGCPANRRSCSPVFSRFQSYTARGSANVETLYQAVGKVSELTSGVTCSRMVLRVLPEIVRTQILRGDRHSRPNPSATLRGIRKFAARQKTGLLAVDGQYVRLG